MPLPIRNRRIFNQVGSSHFVSAATANGAQTSAAPKAARNRRRLNLFNFDTISSIRARRELRAVLFHISFDDVPANSVQSQPSLSVLRQNTHSTSSAFSVANPQRRFIFGSMSSVQQIEAILPKLSRAEMEEVRGLMIFSRINLNSPTK